MVLDLQDGIKQLLMKFLFKKIGILIYISRYKKPILC